MRIEFIYLFVFITLIIFNIIATAGLFYITKFSFSKKDEKGQHCLTMNTTQRNLTRFTCAILWFWLFFTLYFFFNIFRDPIKYLYQP